MEELAGTERSGTMSKPGLAPKLGPAGMVESVLVEIGEDAGMDKAESKASIEAPGCPSSFCFGPHER